MKVAFVGNFRVDFTSETHWAKSLESLGHEVIRMQEHTTTTETILEKSLECQMFVWVHSHRVVIPGTMKIEAVLKELKKKKIPTVAYHLDLYMGLDRWKTYETDPYMNALEYFFTVDKYMEEWLNKNTKTKAFYLPAGVFDREVTMMQPQRVLYDIIFTGSGEYHSEFPFRRELVRFLDDTYRNRFIHIGHGGDIGQKRGMQLNQIYRNAKIVVGDTLQLNFDYPYYYSDRLFEVPGRGGFMIFPDIKGVEDCYEDGKEMVFYKHGDLADLKAKIDYYISHNEEREVIRRAGFERTKRDHTYLERWTTIIDTLKKEGAISEES